MKSICLILSIFITSQLFAVPGYKIDRDDGDSMLVFEDDPTKKIKMGYQVSVHDIDRDNPQYETLLKRRIEETIERSEAENKRLNKMFDENERDRKRYDMVMLGSVGLGVLIGGLVVCFSPKHKEDSSAAKN